MDAGHTHRFAERAVREVSSRTMSPAGWQRYQDAILGLRLALDAGDLPEVRAIAEALAALTFPGQQEQPPRLRTLTDDILRELGERGGGH